MSNIRQSVPEACANCTSNKESCKVTIFNSLNRAGTGVLMPYLSLYFKQLGMTVSQAGTVIGVVSLIMCLVRPLAMWAADRINKHRIFLVLFCVLNGFSFVLLIYVPKEVKFQSTIKINSVMHCNPFNSYIRECSPTKLRHGTDCPVLFTDYVREAAKITEPDFQDQYFKKEQYITGDYHVTKNHSVICGVTCAYVPSQDIKMQFCFSNQSKSLQFHCQENTERLKFGDHINFDMSRVLIPWSFDSSSSTAIHQENGCAYFVVNGFHFEGSPYVNMVCGGNFELQCNMTCADTGFHTCVHRQQTPDQLYNTVLTIFYIIFVYFLAMTIRSSYLTISFVASANILDIHKYWNMRVWGILSYAVFTILGAILVDVYSDEYKQNFKPLFYIYASISFLTSILPASFNFKTKMKSPLTCHYIRSICRKRYAPLVTIVIVSGFFFGVYEAFLFWFIGDKFGDNRLIIPGVTLLITATTEILLYFVSEVIIRKIGVWNCIYIVMGLFFIRFLSFSFLTNPWQLLPLEVLCGVISGILPSALMGISDVMSPSAHWLSDRCVGYSLHFDIGKGLGILVTGSIASKKVLGWTWCFRLYACSTVVCTIVILALNKCEAFRFRTSEEEPQSKKDNQNPCQGDARKDAEQFISSIDDTKTLCNEQDPLTSDLASKANVGVDVKDKVEELTRIDSVKGGNNDQREDIVWSPKESQERQPCLIRCEFVATV